jgi:hypothetical protein
MHCKDFRDRDITVQKKPRNVEVRMKLRIEGFCVHGGHRFALLPVNTKVTTG